ncbi:MAG: PIN domain-containing protein [Bryobacterales bacterium]|nr:PIN domain-containing protein [Bryobacterales bacterium]
MSVVYLDSHVAIWLCDGLTEKLSAAATDAIESSPVLISPMVYQELAYLHRRKRVLDSPAIMYASLNTSFGVTLCSQSFSAVAAVAAELEWTNDPFDRVIVAQAQRNAHSRLVTKDKLIRKHYARAVW